MIDDEAHRQIAGMERGARPLVISDIDEVLLNFVAPFARFLKSRDHHLVTETYRLTGNVIDVATGRAAEQPAVHRLLGAFFDAQEDWQDPVAGALPALESLSADYDIILLTAMPHAHRNIRVEFLRRLGMPWPVLTVESDKGHSVAMIARDRDAVFIDDLAPNHESVAEHAPHVHLFQFMAFRDFSGPMPVPPGKTEYHVDWHQMAQAIRSRLG
jgi:hypothetical protein